MGKKPPDAMNDLISKVLLGPPGQAILSLTNPLTAVLERETVPGGRSGLLEG